MMSQFKRYIVDKKLIEISRAKVDDQPMLCYPLAESKSHLLVQYIFDFYLDGYKIINVSDITSVKRDESIVFCEYIIQSEKLDDFKIPNIELENWHTIMKYFQLSKKTVMIDVNTDKYTELCVGVVKEVNNHGLKLNHIDGKGKLILPNKKINFDSIAQLSFNDRYSDLMGKYAEWK